MSSTANQPNRVGLRHAKSRGKALDCAREGAASSKPEARLMRTGGLRRQRRSTTPRIISAHGVACKVTSTEWSNSSVEPAKVRYAEAATSANGSPPAIDLGKLRGSDRDRLVIGIQKGKRNRRPGPCRACRRAHDAEESQIAAAALREPGRPTLTAFGAPALSGVGE